MYKPIAIGNPAIFLSLNNGVLNVVVDHNEHCSFGFVVQQTLFMHKIELGSVYHDKIKHQ